MTSLLTTLNPATQYRRGVARTRTDLGAPSILDLILRLAIPAGLARKLYPATFNTEQPYLTQVIAHIWHLATLTRLRRFTIAPVLLALVYGAIVSFVFTPEANAASPITSFLGLTDSYGVNPGLYAVSTDNGSLLRPLNTPLAFFLNMLTAAYVDGTCMAIFLLSWVLSFTFLADIVTPFADAAQSSAATVLAPFAVACMSIGATVAAFAFLRGKAETGTKYLASSVLIAMFSAAIFTSAPITWTLSDKGPLLAGRDFGVSLAVNQAPTSGTSTSAVTKLQQDLVTNFVRRPLQVWNFGAVVDDTPACASAWSAGVRSGNPDNIKDGVESCGAPNSRAMKASADRPSFTQVIGGGVGFGLLALAIAAFCVLLAWKIMRTAVRAVIEAFKLVFATLMAYIPGAPQILFFNIGTRLLFSYLAMAAYVFMAMFSGSTVVTILNKNVSHGVIYAVVVSAISMVMIIFTLRSIGQSVDGGASATAARLAAATENRSTMIQPGATVNTRAGLPLLAAGATAAVGYAIKAPARKRDKELADAVKHSTISSNYYGARASDANAHANDAYTNYVTKMTPPDELAPANQKPQPQPDPTPEQPEETTSRATPPSASRAARSLRRDRSTGQRSAAAPVQTGQGSPAATAPQGAAAQPARPNDPPPQRDQPTRPASTRQNAQPAPAPQQPQSPPSSTPTSAPPTSPANRTATPAAAPPPTSPSAPQPPAAPPQPRPTPTPPPDPGPGPGNRGTQQPRTGTAAGPSPFGAQSTPPPPPRTRPAHGATPPNSED